MEGAADVMPPPPVQAWTIMHLAATPDVRDMQPAARCHRKSF